MDVNFGGFTSATPSSGNADGNGYGNFEYEPPSGFLAICSKNLGDEMTIDDPSAHFQIKLYTGTGSSGNALTNDGNSDMQPDMVWIKRRDYDNAHVLQDSSRGFDGSSVRVLQPDSDATEVTNGAFVSFDTDGFEVGGSNATSGAYNASGEPFVAWQWKANGGTVANNTDGGYTTSVQANQTAGFSIATYTGTGGTSPSATNVGHGIGIAPEFVIIRARNRQENWHAYHSASGTGGFILDNNTTHNSSSTLGDALATSTLVDLGTDLRMNGGYNYVMYSWAPIEGYSIFGRYHGNGYHQTAGAYPSGKDGPFIHTGFSPKLIFIKCDSTTGSWTIYDTARGPENPNKSVLFWNSNGDESTSHISGANIDIFSNGFKIKTTDNTLNTLGEIYTYGAWAEYPQQTTTGIPCTARA
jgi:hypothetical protein